MLHIASIRSVVWTFYETNEGHGKENFVTSSIEPILSIHNLDKIAEFPPPFGGGHKVLIQMILGCLYHIELLSIKAKQLQVDYVVVTINP